MTLLVPVIDRDDFPTKLEAHLTFWCCFNQHGRRFDIRATTREEIDILYQRYQFDYEDGQGTYDKPVRVSLFIDMLQCPIVDMQDIQRLVEKGDLAYDISHIKTQ